MVLFCRPSPDQIKRFIDRSNSLPLSYHPIGIARDSPRRFKIDEVSSVIGHGEVAFARAKQALIKWAQFDLGWVELHPQDAPVETGTVVAVLVRHPGHDSIEAMRGAVAE